ncbi:MAG: GAF domain-containing protein [Sneathiellales bacterium]|nr:GAF domain-containing protein [Sneathiellales bacterium]
MTDFMDLKTLMSEMDTLSLAISQGEERSVTWLKADRAYNKLIGHQLFTALYYNRKTGEVERLYSSDPTTYPVGGTKKLEQTPWGKLVLDQGEVFLGNGEQDLRWAFPDYQVLKKMGLGSALNIPITIKGRTFGTINLLHKTGHFVKDHKYFATILAAFLVPLFLDRNKGEVALLGEYVR